MLSTCSGIGGVSAEHKDSLTVAIPRAARSAVIWYGVFYSTKLPSEALLGAEAHAA